MLIPGNFVTVNKSQLHYAIGGQGPTPLLLFHGFGQDYNAFAPLLPELGAQYTLYSFDLFFHGRSDWREDRLLMKEDWKNFLHGFFEKEGIQKFAVAGYSLGGKFALATLGEFPDQTARVFFLAPDGIKLNFWYRIATGTSLLRNLFKSMIKRPGRFQDLVRFLANAKLIHGGIRRFAESQMDTEEKRSRVYNAWVVFRALRFDLDKIAALINDKNIDATFILGQFDKLIPVKNADALAKKLTKKKFIVLDAGHNDIIRNSAHAFDF